MELTIVFRTYALVILNLFQDLKSFIKRSLRERNAHNIKQMALLRDSETSSE